MPERRRRVTALRYEGEGAPKVVASGQGHVAEKILAAAQAAGVPVREDPQLAEALGGTSDDDVLALVADRGSELVRTGETAWLRQHGVPFDFDSRMGFH
jgi:hypothetical protein